MEQSEQRGDSSIPDVEGNVRSPVLTELETRFAAIGTRVSAGRETTEDIEFLLKRSGDMIYEQGATVREQKECIQELEAQLAEVRWAVEMFTNRLNAYEVGRVVTVDGPDDPRARLGSMMYRGSFTNGEMDDAKAILSTDAGKLGAAVIVAAGGWYDWYDAIEPVEEGCSDSEYKLWCAVKSMKERANG